MCLPKMSMLFVMSLFIISCNAMNKQELEQAKMNAETAYNHENSAFDKNMKYLYLGKNILFLEKEDRNKYLTKCDNEINGIDNPHLRAAHYYLFDRKKEEIFGKQSQTNSWEKPFYYGFMTVFATAFFAFMYRNWR